MSEKQFDVTALGELLIDFTCQSTDAAGYPTLKANPGGAPCNFLAALAAYGAKTAFLGKVGEDAFGQMLLGTLQELGVDTRGTVTTPDVFTTLAFVTLDAGGERQFSFARKPGADTCLTAEELDLARIADSRVFHFGSLSLTHQPAREATRRAVAWAGEHGCLITFDPNLRPPLWDDLAEARRQMLWGASQAHVVKVSDEEARFLWDCAPEEAARRLLDEHGVRLAFVTLGAAGCYYATARYSGYVKAPAVRPVDTTGAGDIFGGSAVSRILKLGLPPEELTGGQLRAVARFACTAASLSTQRPGGLTSVPPEAAVLAALEEEKPE